MSALRCAYYRNKVAQQGIPLNAIQEIEAWESIEMIKHYAHLTLKQFRKYAVVVDELLDDSILTQKENKEIIKLI